MNEIVLPAAPCDRRPARLTRMLTAFAAAVVLALPAPSAHALPHQSAHGQASLSAAPADCQSGAPLECHLRAVFQRAVAEENFGGVVLVGRKGQVLFSEAHGVADAATGAPLTTASQFGIGSLSKSFTAAAVLLLQDRGALSVHDPLCSYLDECPEAWRGVTLHHLLTHSSGIPNYFTTQYAGLPLGAPVTPLEILAPFRSRPLTMAPGARHEYSNTNYVALGLVIEGVSGDSYATFVERELLAPLGLRGTRYDASSPDTPAPAERATPSRLRRGALEAAPPVDVSHYYAVGGLASTAGDVYNWVRALHGDRLLSAASREAMFVPHSRGADLAYGYGWYLGTFQGAAHPARPQQTHGGVIVGFRSSIAHYPEDDVTVIVLSNVENALAATLIRRLSEATLAA